MDDDDTHTLSRFMQMMNDLHSNGQKHIDFGDNLFQFRNYTTTQPPIDLFPERDESWSIIWYIASFSGLIAFFLIVSCSEWCCRLHVRSASQTPSNSLRPTATSVSSHASSFQIQEQPPPAYDLFAPPSYESANKSGTPNAAVDRNQEKRQFDVYVVPVHALTMLGAENHLAVEIEVDQSPCGGRGQQAEQHVVGVEDDPPSYISVQMNSHRANLTATS